MLEIETISWKNFLSYGNYLTTLNVANLGQCLITGEVIETDEREAYDDASQDSQKRSNGSGKSNATSIIQWILFGRTSHSPNPSGDNVINWHTGKDCWGQIVFRNGDSITRTRNVNGCNELIYIKDGDENKLVCDTLSTGKNQQLQLNKAFHLDWDIFCGSTFFSQYGLPWLEMPDQARKKALERLLHVDRFTYYSKIAKGKCEALDVNVTTLRAKNNGLDAEVVRLEAERVRLLDASATFAERQRARYHELAKAAGGEETSRDALQLPDLAKLQAKWDVFKQIQTKLQQQQVAANQFLNQANQLNNEISEHEALVTTTQRQIDLWQSKGGKVCTVCEQPVPHEHTATRIEPLVAKLTTARAQIHQSRAAQQALRTQYKDTQALIQKTQVLATERMPQITVRDAQSLHEAWTRHDQAAARLRLQADVVTKESNPHENSTEALEARLATCQQTIQKFNKEIEQFELLNKYYHYIYRAYNDRTRIKSFIFREHVPFINGRLKHYLDVFGLDVQIELTDSLDIKSNLWGYKYESGGERMRTNVAFMLAVFDFHEHMYGRQCNIMVLDEVDGRLDEYGIEAFINIIKDDLASRAETIFIVSHRSQMADVFPHELHIKRQNRFSTLQLL